jgi:pyruvate dehydrogenase (quinone)
MQAALSRRGVAVVAIPGDVALRDAIEQEPRLHFPSPKPTVCPSDQEIATLAKILNKAKKKTILGGAGCAGAHAELIELAGKLNAPIVHAMRGKEFIEYDNPFDVGMTGLLGFSSGYHAMMDSDLLLMIGTNFPYQPFFPKDATIVQIDIRGEQLGRRTKVDYGFGGDTKTTLRALLPKLERPMIAQALKQNGPALVEVLVDRQELSMPPTITAEQVKGFTLFTLKAVLSGRGDEIIDLAKINLFR